MREMMTGAFVPAGGGDCAMNAAITPPRPLGVHHVKVPVTDLGRSRAWYESVFGIEMMIEFPDAEGTVRGVAYAPVNQLTVSLREDPERAAALAGLRQLGRTRGLARRSRRLGRPPGSPRHRARPGAHRYAGLAAACTDPDGIGVRFYTAEHHG